MIRALFPKGKEPRYVFEVLIKTLPEAVLAFTHDGIGLKSLDPTKTVLFNLTFHATALEDYVVEEETKVGLIFTTIKDVIKRISATEKLELEVDNEKNRFSLYVYPKKGKEVGLVRRFSFPIVQVVEEEVPELSLTFDASLK
jgi:DNA polymerase sliding clamp subunit (PCNA homolog)